MTMLCLSARAWNTTQKASILGFYFELKRYRDAQAKGNFPFTPVLPVVFGLDVALNLMLVEASAAVHTPYRAVAERACEGLEDLGLETLANERFLSPTVTAFKVPDGVDDAIPALCHALAETGPTDPTTKA